MKQFLERCEKCAAYRERVLNLSVALLTAAGISVVIWAIVDVSLNSSQKSGRSACRSAQAECKSASSQSNGTGSNSI